LLGWGRRSKGKGGYNKKTECHLGKQKLGPSMVVGLMLDP